MARSGAILAGAKAPRSRGSQTQGPGGARPTPSPQSIMGPNIGQISALAADLANEGGYARTYGSFLQRPTKDFTQGAFGPFSPVLPVSVDQPPEGAPRPEPRRFQYQVGWNLPVGEPGSEGLKLVSFSQLRTIADLYSVARAAIELRKNELTGLEWDITPTPEASKAYQGSKSKMADFGKRRAEAVKFFRHPDPNFFSWTSWLDAFLEEVFVYDALSILLRPKWGKGMGKGLLGSDLDSLQLISGSTIRPLLDLHGGTPRPPAPGYQQYIAGVPRSDLMTMITQRDVEEAGLKGKELNQYRGDQLLYLPMVPRTWTPYGFPPIERAMIPIQSGLQKQIFQLNYFREGTVPSVFISPGDANMTPNQLRELQDALNAIAGDPAWHHKIVVLPPGSKIDPMHTAALADQFDEVVMNQVLMAFNVTPMELGIMPKATLGQSAGASNAAAKESQKIQDRVATKPLLTFLSDIFEAILHRVCGQDDMVFTFEGMQEEEDQETLTGMLIQQATNGLRSIDECREELNLQPWGLPETSEPVMLTPTGPMPFGSSSAAAGAQNQASIAGSNAAASALASGKAAPPGTQPTVEQQQAMQDQKNQGQAAIQDKKNENAQQLQQSQQQHAQQMAQQIAAGQAGTPGHAAAAAGVQGTSSAKPGGGNQSGSSGNSGSSQAPQNTGNSLGSSSSGPSVGSPKNKAAISELQALARHLRKGRHISTWEPKNIPGAVLGGIAEDLTKGIGPDEAVTLALMTLPDDAFRDLPGKEEFHAEKRFDPLESRDSHGRWSSGGSSRILPWDQDSGIIRYHNSSGIDRDDMPQLSGTVSDGRYAPSSEMVPKFMQEMRSKGIGVTYERVSANSLKPTQTTGDMKTVRSIADTINSGGDTKPIIISSDNRVIDGHHTWAAHILADAENGSSPGLQVIRVGLPASQLLTEMDRFDREYGIRHRKTGEISNPAFKSDSLLKWYYDPGELRNRYGRWTAGGKEGTSNTQDAYSDGHGNYIPNREALHQQIINDALEGKDSSGHPVLTFLGGGPASGKTTVFGSNPPPDTVVIDPDAIKAQLPEYQNGIKSGDSSITAAVHEESSDISHELMSQAETRHISVMLDGTGDSSYDKLAGKVAAARAAGYGIQGKYVTVDTDEAVRRANARGQQTGRYIPESVVRAIHSSVSDAFSKAVQNKLFDSAELWDTNGSSPKLVGFQPDGGDWSVRDPAAWESFLSKAEITKADKPMSPGEAAIRLLIAAVTGRDMTDLYVPDTPANRRLLADIKSDIAKLPAGAHIEIPNDHNIDFRVLSSNSAEKVVSGITAEPDWPEWLRFLQPV